MQDPAQFLISPVVSAVSRGSDAEALAAAAGVETIVGHFPTLRLEWKLAITRRYWRQLK